MRAKLSVVGLGILMMSSWAWAQDSQEVPIVIPAKVSSNSKISPLLEELMKVKPRSVFYHSNGGKAPASIENGLIRVQAGRAQVYIKLKQAGVYDEKALNDLGFEIELISEDASTIQGWIAVDQMKILAALPFIQKLSPPDYIRTRSGSVMSEGDQLLKADLVRPLGFDGAGVKVGVISDGVNSILLSQATYDSPAVSVVDYPGDGDEGTAMIEIVHDIAPAAEIGFCGPKTDLEFSQCVTDLRKVFKADIIVDDLGFPGQPYFEDGPVAQTVATAVVDGVFYTSSAGNDGINHHEAIFSGVEIGAYGPAHDFGTAAGSGSDITLNVVVGPKQPVEVFLQWDDSFGHSANDYDLYIFDANGQLLGGSAVTQKGAEDPFEAVGYQNETNESQEVGIVIIKASGGNRHLSLFVAAGGQLSEHLREAGCVVGHPAVKGVMAAAAMDASNPGHSEAENFSCRGPSFIQHPTPETRQKPDITAIDGVAATGVGGFPIPFFGTSAASPHVAGVAALLIKSFPNAQALVARLKQTAVDLGDPGFDTVFGAGLIDAAAAAEGLTQAPTTPTPTPTDPVIPTNPTTPTIPEAPTTPEPIPAPGTPTAPTPVGTPQPAPSMPVEECLHNEDCNDGDDCTADSCSQVNHTCQYQDVCSADPFSTDTSDEVDIEDTNDSAPSSGGGCSLIPEAAVAH